MDWIAAIMEMLGKVLVVRKNRTGFLISAVCNVTWMFVAVRTELWGLLVMMVVFVVINVTGFIKWGKG